MGIFAPFSFLKQKVVVPGPSPVTDTSVLLLDATNPSSYPGSGNTWSDLSGNGNDADVSLVTSYWNAGGYFNWPGTDYTAVATVTHASSLNIFDGDFTLLLVGTIAHSATGFDDNCGPFAKANWLDNPGVGWLVNRASATLGATQILLNNTSAGFSGAGNALFSSAGDWFVAHMIRSGSTVTYYKTDNTSIFSGTLSANGNNSNNLIIGRARNNATAPYRWDGKIAAVGLYDKALSSDERQQNIDYFSGQLGF